MKISFICASLEPGRDGVGDYTRRLAAGCAAEGHEVRIFAINDRHVDTDQVERCDDSTIAFRWTARSSWVLRGAAIPRELERFKPDSLSWQFVSYGFHAKGVTPPQLATFARTLRGYHNQIMLHETWIGIAEGDSPWARFMGWRQSRALLAFLQALRPAHVHTSNLSYAALLSQHGWNATILPLFSNIPVVPAAAAERAAILERHLPPEFARGPRLVGVTFGTLHPQWQPEASAQLLRSVAQYEGRRPIILAIGRTGHHGAAILERLEIAGVPVARTGELPPSEVSSLLQAADLGIASHPWALVGKSGSIAAMRDHGLPILLPRDDWRLRDGPELPAPADPRLARLAGLTQSNAAALLRQRRSPGDSFPAAVSLFLKALAA